MYQFNCTLSEQCLIVYNFQERLCVKSRLEKSATQFYTKSQINPPLGQTYKYKRIGLIQERRHLLVGHLTVSHPFMYKLNR